MRYVTLLMGLLLAGCGDNGNGTHKPDVNPGLPEVVTTSPENTGDGWVTSSAASEGIDADTLLSGLTQIRDGSYPHVDSMLVARHGRLVAEGYFNGFGRDSLHDLRSTGKSFTSALTGIAIEQGLINLDDPISRLIPQFDGHANMDDRKRAITVRNLLNMNSGLECNDWSGSSRGNEINMYEKNDWVGFILDLPMIQEPGVAASYCTGGVVVLGSILATRAGVELDAYAQSYLFGPLGIQSSQWRRSPDGRATGGGGLRLKPRDCAKFGQLYLNGGTWNGARILPAAWVEQSRQRVLELGGTGYGFLWWKRGFTHRTGTVEAFFTSGNGGNFIFVIPALDVVVVFTASNYDEPTMDLPFNILASYVLPAVQ